MAATTASFYEMAGSDMWVPGNLWISWPVLCGKILGSWEAPSQANIEKQPRIDTRGSPLTSTRAAARIPLPNTHQLKKKRICGYMKENPSKKQLSSKRNLFLGSCVSGWGDGLVSLSTVAFEIKVSVLWWQDVCESGRLGKRCDGLAALIVLVFCFTSAFFEGKCQALFGFGDKSFQKTCFTGICLPLCFFSCQHPRVPHESPWAWQRQTALILA